MAVDMFINIDGIKGESKDSAHKNEIDVLSWSWGMSQSGSFHVGGGGGSGKVNVQDLSLTKYVDKASPKLLLHCCNGKHIPKAKMVIRKAGEKVLEYVIIEFEKLMVGSVSTGGSGGEDNLTENVTLNFAKCKVKYTPQKDDGSADTAEEMGWNIEENVSY